MHSLVLLTQGSTACTGKSQMFTCRWRRRRPPPAGWRRRWPPPASTTTASLMSCWISRSSQECFGRSEIASFVRIIYFLTSLLLLFFLLFFLFFFFHWCFLITTLFTLRSLGISRLLAWSLTEPLGQPLCWPLAPLLVLLFPDGIQRFCSDHLPATFIQLLSVIIGSGVCSAFILGVHADHGWVFSNKCFRVKTLLQGLLSQLGLLSFLQLLQVKFLCEFSLF